MKAFSWCPWIPGTLKLDSILSLFKCVPTCHAFRALQDNQRITLLECVTCSIFLASISLASIFLASISLTSIPLSLSMLTTWRLLPVPTQRRSLAFKLDLPSLLSSSLLASRSTKVELRLGFWGSTLVNTGILETLNVSGQGRERRQVQDSSQEGGPGTCVSLRDPGPSLILEIQRAQVCTTVSLNSVINPRSQSVADSPSCALCPEKLTDSSIETG